MSISPFKKNLVSIIGIIVIVFIGLFTTVMFVGESFYHRSLYHLHQGNGNQALHSASSAISIVPFKPEYYYLRARIYQDASLNLLNFTYQNNPKEYWQLALDSAKKAAAISPFDAEAWTYVGQLYSLIPPSYASADVWQIAAFQQAIKSNSYNPILYISLGDMYRDQQNHGEAIRAYNQAIQYKPDYITGYYRLALSYEEMMNWEESIKYYQEVYKRLDPNSPETSLVQAKLEELAYYASSTIQKEQQGNYLLPQ